MQELTCTRCEQPLSSEELLAPSRRLHWACALEEGQEVTRTRIEGEKAREEAQRVAERRTLIELGRRHERAAIVAYIELEAARMERCTNVERGEVELVRALATLITEGAHLEPVDGGES